MNSINGILNNGAVLSGGVQPWFLSAAYLANGELPDLMAEFQNDRYSVNGQPSLLADTMSIDRSGSSVRQNQDGSLAVLSSDTFRLDYRNGVRGLLIEEFVESDIHNDDTLNFSSSLGSITSGQDDPAGDTNAHLLNEGTGSSYHAAYNNQSLTFVNSTEYKLSYFVKPGNTNPANRVQILVSSAVSSTAYVNFYLEGAGAVTAEGTGATGYIKKVGDWYECTMVITGNGGNGNVFANIISNASASRLAAGTGTSKTLFLYGWNRVVLEFPTSFVPSLTADAIRGNDNIEFTGTNFSDWYDASNNTISMAFNIPYPPVSGDFPFLFYIGDGTNDERIYAFVNSSGEISCKVRVGGSEVASVIVSGYTFGSNARIAVTFDGTNISMSLDGGTPDTDTTGSLPTVDQAYIGKSVTSGFYLNGTVHDFYVWPTKVSTSQLQEIAG